MRYHHPRLHPSGKTGVRLVVIGTAIFLAALLAPLAVVLPTVREDSLSERFLAPGELVVEVEEPGRHILWHDFIGIHEGRSHNHDPAIPDGFEITITDGDGRELDFWTSGAATTVTIGNTSRRGIGSVEIETPKTVQITVTGDAPERVLSFSRARLAETMRRSLLAFGIAFPIGIAGLVLVVVGILKFTRPPHPRAGEQVPGYEKEGV